MARLSMAAFPPAVVARVFFFCQVQVQELAVLRHALRRPGSAHSLNPLPSKHLVLVDIRLYL